MLIEILLAARRWISRKTAASTWEFWPRRRRTQFSLRIIPTSTGCGTFGVNSAGSQGNWTTTSWLNHRFNFLRREWRLGVHHGGRRDSRGRNKTTCAIPTRLRRSAAPLALGQAAGEQGPGASAEAGESFPHESAGDGGGNQAAREVNCLAAGTHRQNLRALAAGGARGVTCSTSTASRSADPRRVSILDVFVGEPNATRDTEVGASFVGTFSLVVAGTRHTHNIMRNAVFELRPETAALLADQTNLTVTLVPKLVDGTEPRKSSLASVEFLWAG